MSEYLLGSGDDELKRLRFQHDVWRGDTEHLWQLAGFGAGQAILDLGCGPGLASVDLAKIVGTSGRVVALDASETYAELLKTHVAEEGLSNLEVRVDDVHTGEFGGSSFDRVFARWLFCFLSDHDAIVEKIASAVRPGGKFVALDYFNYLAVDLEPASERFRKIFRNIHRSFSDAGGDLDVGGRLPGIMKRFGFVIDEIVPIVKIGRPGSPVWEWVTEFQKTYVPGLVDLGYITESELADFSEEWRDRAQDSASFFASPPMVGVIGTKKVELAQR